MYQPEVTEQNVNGRISDTHSMVLLNGVTKYRCALGTLVDTWYIQIPLPYTQLVTLAVYFYFLVSLVANQNLDVVRLKAAGHRWEQDSVNLYFPLFTVVEFVTYAGWLQVASNLYFPLYGDPDDFELNNIIDLQVTGHRMYADSIGGTHPPLEWATNSANTMQKPSPKSTIIPVVERV